MEETILVECSRQSSLEGTSRNFTQTAEWTCNTGDGIVLDIGDQISVHSGFVSEKGAQAGTIEIKERPRGGLDAFGLPIISTLVSKDIVYQIPNTPNPTFTAAGVIEEPKQEEIYSHAAEAGGQTTYTPELNDGVTEIIVSPYKTANGEFYASLPRRHIGWNQIIPATIATDLAWATWDSQKGVSHPGKNDPAGVVGNVIYTLDGGYRADGNLTANAWQFAPADYKITFQNDQESIYTTATVADQRQAKGMIRNDCSRYTIFRMDQIFRTAAASFAIRNEKRGNIGGEATDAGSAPRGTEAFQDALDLRDPAVNARWNQVRELVKISSKDGFNTPTDVADEITEQLNKRGEIIEQDIYFRMNADVGILRGTIQKQVLTSHYESPMYKAYNCASQSWDYKMWNNYRAVKDSTDANLDGAQQYMSMYQHIGVKRPELFTQGRLSSPAPTGYLKPDTTIGGNTPTGAQCLNLGLEWTEDNLTLLTKLLDIEGKYPELFVSEIEQEGNEETSPGSGIYVKYPLQGPLKHRFLHFNLQDEAAHSAVIGGHYPKRSLGYDLYGPITEGGGAAPILPAGYKYDATMATFPIFFDYNPALATAGTLDVGYTEDAGGGVSDYNDLAYGWARRMRVLVPQVGGAPPLEKFFIGIQFTLTGNAVPKFLFNKSTHIALNGFGGRRWGFDWHFSAFGNPCICLYSGLVPTGLTGQPGIPHTNLDKSMSTILTANGNKHNNVNTAPYYRQLLLGADEPQLKFDSVRERFSFSNLHIAERPGNPSNAGHTTQALPAKPGPVQPGPEIPAVPEFSVPGNEQAGSVCYKINKALLGNNYCPNMAPYGPALEIAAGGSAPKQLMLSNNFEPFIPYDATSGIFIEDVLVPANSWDSNLIGVLGYDYSQFNNDDIIRQTIINNRRDSSNLASLTTQAKINAGDMVEWTKSGFDFATYGLTNPISWNRAGLLGIKDPLQDFQNIRPPVTTFLTAGEDSTLITALDLPTKTARPYYTIRSDIAPQSSFIGGNGDLNRPTAGVNRPVVAIVNKINGYGDFYSQGDTQLSFTNTNKRVLTSVKTSVHDPDGSFAKVNNDSAVIYKIVKKRNIDLTPVNTLLASKKKADILAAEQATQMIMNPQDMDVKYPSQIFK